VITTPSHTDNKKALILKEKLHLAPLNKMHYYYYYF